MFTLRIQFDSPLNKCLPSVMLIHMGLKILSYTLKTSVVLKSLPLGITIIQYDNNYQLHEELSIIQNGIKNPHYRVAHEYSVKGIGTYL